MSEWKKRSAENTVLVTEITNENLESLSHNEVTGYLGNCFENFCITGVQTDVDGERHWPYKYIDARKVLISFKDLGGEKEKERKVLLSSLFNGKINKTDSRADPKEILMTDIEEIVLEKSN